MGHQFHSIRPRISPQWFIGLRWLWTTVPRWEGLACELISLMGSHTVPGQHSQSTLTSLGQNCMHDCVAVTCHLHLWQDDQGLLHATVVTGVQQIPNKNQHRKLTLEQWHDNRHLIINLKQYFTVPIRKAPLFTNIPLFKVLRRQLNA